MGETRNIWKNLKNKFLESGHLEDREEDFREMVYNKGM
jgi:hypothetical protein